MNCDGRISEQVLVSLIGRFEKAWADGNSPAIEQFVENAVDSGRIPPDGRLQLLSELVPIDLENRWRRWGRSAAPPANPTAERVGQLPRLPRLEHYLQRFPELGSAGAITAEMVADEFWARHYWGDCPSVDEYLERFGSLRGKLRVSLSIALAELGREEEALAVLEARFGGAIYEAVPASLLRGQLYEQRGELQQAILAYSRVVELWRDCDPELVPQREVAERALERLVTKG